ncbi:PEP-CTERM sorting domain-containing protein [Paludisphaera soli]|uniref:PEP-CTERM sorting domain-containing protein n=1 Tax=Paludisphaera soli TaxID=2712865 RepID=UPI0013E9DF13|nr:PEP-CTERM sorting domain-containing protein [Paludisphaera soli]
MPRRAGLFSVMVASSLLIPAAKADFVVRTETLEGEWSTTEGGTLSNPDGPRFGSLPPAPGVQGFKMSGSAEMVAQGESDETTLSAAFRGDASGTVTEANVLVGLRGGVEVLTSSPDTRSLVVRLMIDLALVDDATGASRNAVLDTSFAYSIDESMIYSFDREFTFDLSAFQGLRVTGVSGLVSLSSSFFSEDAGDVVRLSIPDSSLDFGLGGATAVPEPSSLASGGLAVLLVLGYARRRRRA